MDMIALATMAAYIKVGDPKSARHRNLNSPVNTVMQDNLENRTVDFGISPINTKAQVGETLSADKKSIAFADILRAACEHRMNSQG